MSQRPIARSPDLLRLRNEGYDVSIQQGFVLVRDVPYVTAVRQVRRGILIVQLNLMGDVTAKPASHVAYWSGEHPCHRSGSKISSFEHPSGPVSLGDGIQADHIFSAKADYRDYHHLVTTYVGRIAGEAGEVEPGATAQTFPVVVAEDEGDVFRYVDTASSRAGIGAANNRIAGQRVAIIGLGGTGAYVLDMVSKTSVQEIHLFDHDVFSQHNAFRAPGAPCLEQLAARPKKVAHFAQVYSALRHGVVPHGTFINGSNVRLLDSFDFVFLCMDDGPAKREIVVALTDAGTPFTDAGMGLLLNDVGQIGGLIRVTTSRPGSREASLQHISFADASSIGGEYATNIQVVELNALNAALAVVSWKKVFSFYQAAGEEIYSGFSIRTGEVVTEVAG